MALKSMKNKKGDISITILVIGVFAVCSFAIGSFAWHEANIKNNFVNVDVFSNLSYQLDNYYFYVNSGLSPQEAAIKVGGQLQGNQLTLTSEQRTEPNVLGKSNSIISIKYIIDLSK
jgi:hypothetical protein